MGRLLRAWRRVRGISQLDLALRTGISSRHLSFVETGRAQASREVVLQLADSLELPLRERNALLNAAGYASLFTEGPLEGAELEQAVGAVDSLFAKLEPYPAWLLDRLWNFRRMNRAAERLATVFVGAERLAQLRADGRLNMLRLCFSPDLLRPHIANWDRLAPIMLAGVRRDTMGPAPDARVEALLEELLGRGDVPSAWRLPDPEVDVPAVIPVVLRKGELELEFVALNTTFGRHQDGQLEDLWIQSCLPGNTATERFFNQV